MIYSIYPDKDATIYERYDELNTGTDSILELRHDLVGTSSYYNSRCLIKFDVSGIEADVNSGKISKNAKYYLALKIVEPFEIPFEYDIYAHPISASWSNGTGKFSHQPSTTDGASWFYRTAKTVGVEWDVPPTIPSLEWDSISQTWVDANILFGSNLSIDVTSSYFSNVGGGTWWSADNLECFQNFSYEASDVFMDVSSIVKKWITGSGKLQNDGIILKFSDDVEKLNQSFSSIKFFSTDSNTIYVPRLYVVWDDSQFVTGSLTAVDVENLNINVTLKKEYSQNEKAKIKIYANSRYPVKTYSTESYYTKNYYLPSSSYYEIRDAHTDDVIIPFDSSGSKISCDSNGNYFNLWMNSFQPERFYRIAIKVETNGGNNVQMFDNNYYFKVVR